MKFQIDHDYHIHTHLSSCSRDPEQTPENILGYAKSKGLKTVCVTDHYWDSAIEGASKWYMPQNFEHISGSLPLPRDDKTEFLFGCECDMNAAMTLGMPESRYKDFDFIIIPTTHLHMTGFTISDDAHESSAERAELWVRRLDALLDMSLPFRKTGIAHLACGLIDNRSDEDYIKTISLIPENETERLFKKAARLGCGIEINQSDMEKAMMHPDEVLRIFRTAKACGCKFYLGSDSHHPYEFEHAEECFRFGIDMLGLTENDKFHIEKDAY